MKLYNQAAELKAAKAAAAAARGGSATDSACALPATDGLKDRYKLNIQAGCLVASIGLSLCVYHSMEGVGRRMPLSAIDRHSLIRPLSAQVTHRHGWPSTPVVAAAGRGRLCHRRPILGRQPLAAAARRTGLRTASRQKRLHLAVVHSAGRRPAAGVSHELVCVSYGPEAPHTVNVGCM